MTQTATYLLFDGSPLLSTGMDKTQTREVTPVSEESLFPGRFALLLADFPESAKNIRDVENLASIWLCLKCESDGFMEMISDDTFRGIVSVGRRLRRRLERLGDICLVEGVSIGQITTICPVKRLRVCVQLEVDRLRQMVKEDFHVCALTQGGRGANRVNWSS